MIVKDNNKRAVLTKKKRLANKKTIKRTKH